LIVDRADKLQEFIMRTKSLALVAAFWGAAAACAQAQPRATQVGTLDCNVAAGIGLIVTSQKAMVCTFTSIRGGKEVYTGTVRKFGLDIGATAGGKIIWSVFAPGRAVRGALAGDYAGGSAEATIGAGLGANVLIGGSNRSIALQPLSVSGQEGLNLAIGVADLQLRVARR
jgi:uncharacterized protein DUF992